MDRQAILTKAIQKAMDNGWKGVLDMKEWRDEAFYYPDGEGLLTWEWSDNKQVFHDGEYDDYEEVRIEAILYDHDFAKALWGNNSIFINGDEFDLNHPLIDEIPHYEKWKYHLQQMVIADDPIQYLADNMEVR